MFEPITGLPDGVIGFEAVGKIQAADYEDVLMPAIARGAAGGSVRLLFVLGDRFTGYSPGAMKEDAGLIAHADAKSTDHQFNGDRTIGHSDGMSTASPIRQELFKTPDERPCR